MKLMWGDRTEICWNGIWKYFRRHDSNRKNRNNYIFEGEFQDWTTGRIKTMSWEIKLHKTKVGRRNLTAWNTACFEKQIVSQPVMQSRKPYAHVCRVRTFNAVFTGIRYLSPFWSKYFKPTAFYHIPLILFFLSLTPTLHPRCVFTKGLVWTPSHRACYVPISC